MQRALWFGWKRAAGFRVLDACKWRSLSSSFSTVVAEAAVENSENSPPPGRDPQALYQEINENLNSDQLPAKNIFKAFLQSCSTPEDLELAFQTTERLRNKRASVGAQLTNFDPPTTSLLVTACISAGQAEKGLNLLKKHNTLGITPTPEAAASLLAEARRKGNVSFTFEILRALKASSVVPAPRQTNLTVRFLRYKREAVSLLEAAQELADMGAELDQHSCRSAMSVAAENGDYETALRWRKELQALDPPPYKGLDSPAVQVALMGGDVDRAVELIMASEEGGNAKKLKLLTWLIRGWPQNIQKYKEATGRGVDLSEVKEQVKFLVDRLRAHGVEVKLDVETEFGKNRKRSSDSVEEEPAGGESDVEKAGS